MVSWTKKKKVQKEIMWPKLFLGERMKEYKKLKNLEKEF